MNKQPLLVNVSKDRLVITLCDSDGAADLVETIKQMGKEHGYAFHLGKYKYGCSIPIASARDCLTIYAKDDGSLKIVWNPSKMSLDEHKLIRKHLQDITGLCFHKIWTNAVVEEFHLAFDFAYTTPDDFSCIKKNQRKSSVHTNAEGATETIYLGGRNAPTIVYNKTLQLMDTRKNMRKKQNLMWLDRFVVPKFNLTRVEERVRRFKKTVCNVHQKPVNPFDKIEFIWYSMLEKYNLASPLFIDSCRLRGVHAALARATDGQREQVYRFLVHNQVSLVTNDVLNREIEHAYQALMVLAPQKQWNAHLRSIPEQLHDYRHTGIISPHLLSCAVKGKKPNARQVQILGASCAKNDWTKQFVGMPITRQVAEDLILAQLPPKL